MMDPIRFTALCPTCDREIDQGTFSADALGEFLDERTLLFYCPRCNAEWPPREQEFESIQHLLANRLTPAA